MNEKSLKSKNKEMHKRLQNEVIYASATIPDLLLSFRFALATLHPTSDFSDIRYSSTYAHMVVYNT